MRITAKGQVTIPVEIRQRMGLLPNTEVEFAVRRGCVQLRRAPNQVAGRGRALVAHLKGKGTIRMTTDEILSLTRG